MAGLDQQERIGGQEIRGHRHDATIGCEEVRVIAQTLDERENVIPAAAIKTNDVVFEFEQDFIHLERRRQRFDQDRAAERAVFDAERFFRIGEDVVPQAGFFVAFHFGQVESGRLALRDHGFRVVEDIKAKIEERTGHPLAIDQYMLFRQMPAAWAHHQGGGIGADGVGLARCFVGKAERAGPAVFEIDLAFDHIRPSRRGGVLEIGHEHFRAGIQRVDDHFFVDRSGDFNAAVEQIGGQRSNRPIAFADRFSLDEEVGQFAGIEFLLALGAGGKEAQAGWIEARVQFRQKGERGGCQDFIVAGTHRAFEVNLRHGAVPLSFLDCLI